MLDEVLKPKPKQRRVLVVVDADPSANPRAAEALRMAGGVGVWDQLDVHVALCGLAVKAKGEGVAQLPEARIIEQFLPMIREHGGRVHVMPVATTDGKLAELAAEFDSVMRF